MGPGGALKPAPWLEVWRRQRSWVRLHPILWAGGGQAVSAHTVKEIKMKGVTGGRSTGGGSTMAGITVKGTLVCTHSQCFAHHWPF